MIKRIEMGPGHVAFCDIEGDKVVSSLHFYMVKLPSRNLGVIEEVKTEEAYRKQGRATRLIQAAIEYGDQWYVDVIELTVREDRPDLQEFYKSLGFTDRLNRAMRLKL